MKPTETKNLNQIYDSLLLLELLDQVGCKNQISDLEANIIQVQESQSKYLEFPNQAPTPKSQTSDKGAGKMASGNFSEFLGKSDRDTPQIFDAGPKSLFGDLKFFATAGQTAISSGVDPNTNALFADAVINGAQVG